MSRRRRTTDLTADARHCSAGPYNGTGRTQCTRQRRWKHQQQQREMGGSEEGQQGGVPGKIMQIGACAREGGHVGKCDTQGTAGEGPA